MEPNRLGRYVIESVLGKGAMGVVYLARDPVIGRRVALKTLTIPSDAEEAEEFRKRFLREAQAAGMLNHPGIVTVHDAGVDDETGLSFIAMEYIEGRSLRDFLRSGHGFAFSEVSRIGAALAGALDYAHSKGVVHRDIKPANILFTTQGMVKIADFGVARLESSNLTATGQFIGTPNYMSPEQVAGGMVDGRSDLFSLGVVLFELLTGQRPFPGQTLTEVAYKIVHEPARIPSQVRPGLPSAFNPIVLKLLEKDPARRYARGADIARALEALRRVLAGMTGDVSQFTAPAPQQASAEPGAVAASPTATRATELGPVPPTGAATEEKPSKPSIWRLPIAARWAVLLLAGVIVPPALLLGLLASRIDRGPWGGPSTAEAQRRHRVADAQRWASEALTTGRPEGALTLLASVLDQAPYSALAHGLRQEALGQQGAQRDAAAREQQAAALREEGKALLRERRWREAQNRFQRVVDLVPNDAVAREYLDLAREHQLVPRPQPVRTPVVVVAAAPAPAAPVGDARLELYFNSPLSVGSIMLKLDDEALADKPFDFRTKGFLGIRGKGSGVIEDAYTVKSGEHKLLVRLANADGALLGEQTLPVSFAVGGRYVLKVEMDGSRSVPRFNLTAVKGR
ncbi:MAG: serine/threonine protein kinase [Thermoanaerobaculaceae bacterium]|nr:serine/threonine protein kinase [Thermoanaerobaculaceae bacterium]